MKVYKPGDIIVYNNPIYTKTWQGRKLRVINKHNNIYKLSILEDCEDFRKGHIVRLSQDRFLDQVPINRRTKHHWPEWL